uniref:START domain-containing protein 1 n=1 Tax=Electrophorus electricus TaxID=8005 RepID=A0A4W4EWF6_ELEEL
MLSAVAKLCCGISYPHSRNAAGRSGRVGSAHSRITVRRVTAGLFTEGMAEGPNAMEMDLSYRRQGCRALRKALEIVQSPDGWRTERTEDSGDTIYSKVLHGNRKVFRLEAELEAEPDELYDVLFVKVEEMHQWNPSIQHIKVLKHIGKETMVTHEVSAERAGNLIGQRDFLSVRHSLKTGTCIYLGGAATHLDALPPQPGFVRAEDGPTCIVVQSLPGTPGRSRFTWLLNMNVKGWLPKALVNQGLVRSQADFMEHLRRQLAAKGRGSGKQRGGE